MGIAIVTYRYESIITNKPYKGDDILYKNTFGVKMVQPSKVESYLKLIHEQIGDNKIRYQNAAKG